jgi:phosphoribosylanthranilate isomerase
MITQIYAFTKIEQALAAADYGVNNIGFVAGAYGMVPGELTFQQAAEMAAALKGKATSVALTMSTDVEEILRMAAFVKPDILHISTDVEDVNEAAMRQIRARMAQSTRLMKAIHVSGEESLRLALTYEKCSDLILLDTKVTGMPGVGATGRTHDWGLSQKIVSSVKIPVILAGGLGPENVAAAMQKVHPWGVDSNTLTNIEGDPAAKDMDKVRRFVDAVRMVEAM